MTAALILWSHAVAALLFAALAIWSLRGEDRVLPRRPLAAALFLTALWALAAAGIGPADLVTRLSEGLRNLGWLAYLFTLHRRDAHEQRRATLGAVYGVVAGLVLATLVLHVAVGALPGETAGPFETLALIFRMLATVTALVIARRVYDAVAPVHGTGMRPIALAIGAMWLLDLNLFVVAYLTGGWPDQLAAVRGLIAALLAAPVAIGLHHRREWPLHVSRSLVYQLVTLAAIALYVALFAAAMSAIGAVGGANARVLQTAFVFGSAATILAIVSSPWLRAWSRVTIAKHLFRHRYDYRAEWMRFTETLGRPEGGAPLDIRIIKAVADLTDSPAGLLLLPAECGFAPGADWNWDAHGLPQMGEGGALAAFLGSNGRIVELDMVRGGHASDAEIAAVPATLLELEAAWVLVPLQHLDRLAGIILLARPPVSRALDWEDFDLLKVAGRQAASYLAEARAQDALAEAQRFDEFNRRFAFIMHDIKNLVSQLTLVARNAERHAGNPEFRADMVATLKGSADRMTDLLARLSPTVAEPRADTQRAVDVMPLVREIAAAQRRRHDVRVAGPRTAVASACPGRLAQVIGHLVQNAIEASPAGTPVAVNVIADGAQVTIEIVDAGAGMSAAFIRDKLFKPFVSSKPGGFGLGAYEARQLVIAMGGTIEVASEPGNGARFSVRLPAAHPADIAIEVAA